MELKLCKLPDSKLIFLGLAILALALRSVYFSQTAWYLAPATGSDGEFYLRWAEDIVRGNIIGKDVFYGLPLYPYVLAILYLFCGSDIFWMMLGQIVIGAVSCGLIYTLGKRLFNEGAGIIASLIACGYFMFIFYDRMFLPSTTAIFLGLLFALSLLKIKDNPNSKKWFGAGLFLGICTLTAASFSMLVVFILFWIPFEYIRKSVGQRLLYCVSFILAFSLVVGVTTLRNYLVAKDAVFITAHSGINFYIGNNPQANGAFNAPPYMRRTQSDLLEDAQLFAEKMSGGKLKASEASNFWFKKALSFIKSQPVKYLKLLGRKFALFLSGGELVDEIGYFIYNEKAPFSRFVFFKFSLICPLAISGMFFSWAQRKKIALLYLFALSFMLSTVSFFINSRYRLMAVPYFIIFAGAALWQFFEKVRKREYKNFVFALASVIVFYFLTNTNVAEGDLGQHNFTYYYNKGVISSDNGDYWKAKRQFQAAVYLNPQDPLSYLALGNTYYHLRDFEKAVDNYEKALLINPYFYTAHFNLGILCNETGRKKRAEKEFKEVLQLKPDHCAAHYNLGRIYQQRGLKEQALEEYEEALKIKPGNQEIIKAINEIRQHSQGN